MDIVVKSFQELSSQQLYDILALRIEIFVVEQNCPYQDLDGKDQYSHHVLGYKGLNLVAYTRVLPRGISYDDYASIGRVVTKSTVRGAGSGATIMNASITACKELFSNEDIKISAQCYALSFYEKLGFEAIGEEYLEDDIPHKAMIYHI